MVYEDKIVIESQYSIYTISLNKMEICNIGSNNCIEIDTSMYLYLPICQNEYDNICLYINSFLSFKIQSLLKYNERSRWACPLLSSENEKEIIHIYNKLLQFDTLKIKNYSSLMNLKVNKYDTNEIKIAVMNLISLFDKNTMIDIEQYISLKILFFKDKESILRNIYLPLSTSVGKREEIAEAFGKGLNISSDFKEIIIGLQYLTIKSPKILYYKMRYAEKEIEKFLKQNRELVKCLDDANDVLENFKKIIQQRYSLSDADSSDLAWLLVNQNLMRLYHDKWLEYCVCGDIGDRSLKDYIQDCYNNDMISLENKEAVSTFIYYYCYKLNDPINQPDIKTVNEILSCIEEVSKDTSLKSMENLLFSSNSSSNKKLFTSIDDIDLMDGTEFEELIAKLFRKMGYDAEVTKASGDQGVDVIATKNGFKYGIQAKCYSGQVGNSAIQEVVAGKTYYSLNKAIVVTNNFFTKSAIKLAEANGVVLWDRNILKEKLMYLNQ